MSLAAARRLLPVRPTVWAQAWGWVWVMSPHMISRDLDPLPPPTQLILDPYLAGDAAGGGAVCDRGEFHAGWGGVCGDETCEPLIWCGVPTCGRGRAVKSAV